MVGLGDLAGGAFSSTATGVSGDGSVVVGIGYTGAPAYLGLEAFIWDATNGMRNLKSVLATDFGLGAALTGWTLASAEGVSADGLTIVGFGVNPSGGIEAWVADLHTAASGVPEPSTLILMGAGLAALAAWRRRAIRRED
jgi:uncharacterized membrane protein